MDLYWKTMNKWYTYKLIYPQLPLVLWLKLCVYYFSVSFCLLYKQKCFILGLSDEVQYVVLINCQDLCKKLFFIIVRMCNLWTHSLLKFCGRHCWTFLSSSPALCCLFSEVSPCSSLLHDWNSLTGEKAVAVEALSLGVVRLERWMQRHILLLLQYISNIICSSVNNFREFTSQIVLGFCLMCCRTEDLVLFQFKRMNYSQSGHTHRKLNCNYELEWQEKEFTGL